MGWIGLECLFGLHRGHDPNSLWGWADDGEIIRYDSAAWHTETTSADKGRIVFVASNGTETYAVGENGLVIVPEGRDGMVTADLLDSVEVNVE